MSLGAMFFSVAGLIALSLATTRYSEDIMTKYNNGNPLRVVTLCSGYDSQCLAINRLGIPYELVAWSEIDKYAIKAHDALFPQWAGRNLGDMTKIDWAQVPDFDLLTYSTPCQSISSAGLQHGFTEGSGTRSSIIWNVRDAIKVKRPRYLLLENVKAMVSKKFLPMFQLRCGEVERLGYRNYHQVLNAKDYGVPQNRERIFLVSIRDDVAQSFQFPKPKELTLTLDDVLEDEVDRKYYLSHERIEGLLLSTLEEMKKKRGYKFSVKKKVTSRSASSADAGAERPTIL